MRLCCIPVMRSCRPQISLAIGARFRPMRMSSNDEGSSSLMDTVDQVRSKLPTSSWDELWKDGLTPWDLGTPTPVLISELEHIKNMGQSQPLPVRMRSLVPGCGGGYDLLTLQNHHTALLRQNPLLSTMESVVVGLDVSATALQNAERTVQAAAQNSDLTRVELRCGDFFDNASKWETLYSSKGGRPESEPVTYFDFIFDYTFFCALPPHLRSNWGERMSKLLQPGTGKLLTLIFPILPEAEMKGPPFPVSVQDYIDVLEPHGIIMDGKPFESPLTVPSRAGKEMVCYWKFDQCSED